MNQEQRLGKEHQQQSSGEKLGPTEALAGEQSGHIGVSQVFYHERGGRGN
jgi:hypothetical protein